MSLSRRDLISRAAAAAGALALAPACAPLAGTSSSSPTSAAGASTGGALKVSKFSYGVSNPPTTLAGFVESLWDEYAKKRGVSVPTEFISPDNTNQILASGRLDMVTFTPTASANLQIQGAGKPKVIVSTQPINDYVIVANRAKVPTIKDIAGKNFAVSSPGTISAFIPQLAFAKAGVDFKTAGVVIVPVGGSSARVTALLAKKVDAAGLYHDDAINTIKKDPDMFILMDTSKYVPFVFASVQVNSTISANADTVEGLILALMGRAEMLKWVVTHKAEFVNLYMAKFPTADKAVAAEAYDVYVDIKMWDPDLTLDLAAYETTKDLSLTAAPPLLTGTILLKDWVDTSLTAEALKRLGGTGWWKK